MADHTFPRTYRSRSPVTVEPGDTVFDDPEWLADAAAGALSNIYGYECVYDQIELVAPV